MEKLVVFPHFSFIYKITEREETTTKTIKEEKEDATTEKEGKGRLISLNIKLKRTERNKKMLLILQWTKRVSG